MKLDIVIHSSDSNPMYLDFWPLVSKVWNIRFGLRPLLVYIDEDHTIPIDTTYGDVIKMKPLPDIPKYLQCQCVRFWIATQYPDKICMTSDIDMFPVSKAYFLDTLAGVPNDKYVHLNANMTTLTGYLIYLPVCYHVAKGSLFRKVHDIEPSWPEFMGKLNRIAAVPNRYNQSVEFLKDKPQWGIDEDYTTERILSYPDRSLFLMVNRTHARIDRSDWKWTEEDIKADVYADSHSIRPYRDPENRHRIQILVDYLTRPRTLQNILNKRT
jgi:hypothetical protein